MTLHTAAVKKKKKRRLKDCIQKNTSSVLLHRPFSLTQDPCRGLLDRHEATAAKYRRAYQFIKAARRLERSPGEALSGSLAKEAEKDAESEMEMASENRRNGR